MKITETHFEDHQAVKLENDQIKLWVTVSCGPRILGLSAFDSENLFVVLPDAALDYPGEGDYYLRGGHRLWYAPEIPERTYIPDNAPVDWQEFENGIRLVQPVDELTMVQKSMQITLELDSPKVYINHFLKNVGQDVIELAPWAITQLRPGGLGVIPQKTTNQDINGLQPNRHIVLWPYTKVNSPNIFLTDEGIFVKATIEEGALKLGAPNPLGWMAYATEDLLFVKRSEYREEAAYLDRRASSQIYCNPFFIELETLAPLQTLPPGESANHKEIWEVYQKGHWPEEMFNLLRTVPEIASF